MSRQAEGHLRCALSAATVLACVSAAGAQVLRIDEAEDCRIACTHQKPAETIWASGGKVTPPFWGFEAGESVEWIARTEKPLEGVRLGVRYSYAAQAYRDFHHTENPDRVLHLTIDGGKAIRVPVPDTSWWDIFETTHVDLPRIEAGEHVFRIVSPAKHETTNLDCFIFYKGDPKCIPPNLRSTIVRLPPPTTAPTREPTSPRFTIRVTPKAVMRMQPRAILTQFDRIYEHYEKAMGWAPPTPIGINIIEDGRWPNPGATAFQNGYGVFFRAGVMDTEQGNWCHEMTHMFYVAHFPGWFDESSVRTLTIFDWVPQLFRPSGRPDRDPLYRRCAAEGEQVLKNPGTTYDAVEPIQYAVRVKYGPQVFSRFFHACVEAARRGELEFRPGRHLTKVEIVKYMSQAAGEDVEPLYRRWKGFDNVP